MTVTVKRSCNSNVTVRDKSITFNSFVITIDGARFEDFAIIADRVMISRDTPDRNAKILEHIITNALVHYATELIKPEEADE